MPNVFGNRVQLQQVILNLVVNAIEAMHSTQNRMMKIKSNLSKPDVVHVSIEDNGSGIDPSNPERIFKPLFTTKTRGMGMGLSICHSIIESHSGRIWVLPAINRGSIFEFELPVNTAQEASRMKVALGQNVRNSEDIESPTPKKAARAASQIT